VSKITKSNSDLNKDIGIDDNATSTAITIDASENVSLVGTLTGTVLNDSDGNVRSGRKNLIINGGFDVWQRGTSFSYTSAGANKYSADRWRQEGYGYTGSVTKTTLGNYSAIAFAVTNSSAGYTGLVQRVEITGSSLLGETVTLSYQIKGSGSFNIATQITGTSNTVAVTASTQELSHTHTVSSSDISNGFITVRFQFSGGDTGTITVSQVQLELGSVATDFEHRSYGEELALCQRYYQAKTSINIIGSYTGSTSGSNLYRVANIPLIPQMRTVPSATVVGSVASGAWYLNSSSHTNLQAAVYIASASGEYQVTSFTADAEL